MSLGEMIPDVFYGEHLVPGIEQYFTTGLGELLKPAFMHAGEPRLQPENVCMGSPALSPIGARAVRPDAADRENKTRRSNSWLIVF